MASPPKSREELAAEAMFVYRGTVKDVREQAAGEQVLVEADLDVEEVEEALLGGGEEGTVVVRYRRVGEVPAGTTVDFGQHSPLRTGARVRVYVTYDAEGRAQLLEPNGWEPVE